MRDFEDQPGGPPLAVVEGVDGRRRQRTPLTARAEPAELHALAYFVHGALTALHTLGAIYNFRRRNWKDVAIHVAAALYDARSVRHHYRTEQIALRSRLSSAPRLVTAGLDADLASTPSRDARAEIGRRLVG